MRAAFQANPFHLLAFYQHLHLFFTFIAAVLTPALASFAACPQWSKTLLGDAVDRGPGSELDWKAAAAAAVEVDC